MIPTPSFRTLAQYDEWSAAHMVAMNRLAVTNPQEWERLAIRIEGLLRAINTNRQAAA